MNYHAEQSAGHYDFDLEYPDGSRAAVEVTTSTDEMHEATAAAITNRRKGGSFVRAKKCRKDWIVHPLPSANINRIRSLVDECLADIEADGLDRFTSMIDSDDYHSVARIFRELEIEGGSVVRWKNSVQINIALPGGGGFVKPDNFQKAIRLEAFKLDNRKKLGSSGFSERHLFVYVSPRNFLAWTVLFDGEPPAEFLPLPDEVSDVWAVTSAGQKDQYKVWKGNANAGWQSLGVVSAKC